MSLTIIRVLRGNPRWVQTTFTQDDEQGVPQPTDPADVYFSVDAPDGVTTTKFGQSGSPIQQVAVGTYRAPVLNNLLGDFKWRLSAPGFAADEGWFHCYDYLPTNIP